MNETNYDEMSELTALIERLRRSPPRKGFPRKTFAQMAEEQGVGPINIDRLMAKSPGPFYEGFEEDIRRMRRGLPPLGPRE
jgi:hypothetical protein